MQKENHHMQLMKAYENAQRIAFAPFIFQATIAARDCGILNCLGQADSPMSIEEIARATNVSQYGVQVLLELLSCAGVVSYDDLKRYSLTKTGECLIYDAMTEVNLNFSNDVNYCALSHTAQAIQEGKPSGLKVFDENWTTIYPHLKDLPNKTQKSWFSFDHFHSDTAYRDALNILKSTSFKHFVDIGGNTGRFTKMALHTWKESTATIVDLPEQLQLMRANTDITQDEHKRINGYAINWLDQKARLLLEKQADLIWMSQFLDCFSRDEAISILSRAQSALSEQGLIAILEPLWDKQRNQTSALSLTATSLYFTVLANGNSRFFSSQELTDIIEAAGLRVVQTHHNLGISHSLYICEKAKIR